ncbi:unnamed protein product [Mytilus coruscus]|uniref:Uncharacterized protein n=1 Tax=Mytilus coruscus TaxID=42192 RepID=A0A6J8B8N6_MYTCO|nr:unnamed protein product [Mytilus coruscus]
MEIDKARTPLYEMLMHHLHGTVSTGSTVEGSYLPGSDVDRMFIDQNMIAILDEKEEKDSEKCTFLLNTKQNQSCFVKLALLKCPHESTLNVEVRDFLAEKEGMYFLCSEKYRNRNFDIVCRSIDLDTTEGIQCSKWPMVALEWISRERNSIWPPKYRIDKALDFPVHVVLSACELNVEIVFALKIFSIIRLGILYHLDYINITDPSPLYFEGGIFQSEFVDSSNPDEKHIRLETARCSFDIECSLDHLSGYLYQAMFLLVQNDLNKMLEGIAKIFEKSLILKYEGFCSSNRNVKISDGEISITNDVPDICDDKIPGPMSYDIFLTGHDVRCVPKAVKFECELNDYDEATPNRQEKQFKTLGQLDKITKIVKDENDGYCALNLLGYCFNEVGDEERAFSTFRLSLQTKNSAYNAATYHLYLMNIVGYEEHVNTLRMMNTVRDNLQSDENWTTIPSGSFGEGLEMRAVCEDTHIDLNPDKVHFKMEMEDTHLGFTKLRLVSRIYQVLLMCDEIDSSFYLSNYSYKQHFSNNALSTVHGPCISDKYGFLDFAYCLHSKLWITPAKQWITRSDNAWPSYEAHSDLNALKKCCICRNTAYVTYKCQHCNIYLCEICRCQHETENKTHNLIVNNPVTFREEDDNLDVCQNLHHESAKLKYFCNSSNCQRVLCPSCVIAEHRDISKHELEDINEAFEKRKKELGNDVESLRSRILHVESTIQKIVDNTNTFQNERDEFHRKVDDIYNTGINVLEEKRKRVLDKYNIIFQMKNSKAVTKIDNLDSFLTNSKECCSLSEQLINRNSKRSFLDVHQTVEAHMKRYLNTPVEKSTSGENDSEEKRIDFDDYLRSFERNVEILENDVGYGFNEPLSEPAKYIGLLKPIQLDEGQQNETEDRRMHRDFRQLGRGNLIRNGIAHDQRHLEFDHFEKKKQIYNGVAEVRNFLGQAIWCIILVIVLHEILLIPLIFKEHGYRKYAEITGLKFDTQLESQFACRSADYQSVSTKPLQNMLCGSTGRLFKYKGVFANTSFVFGKESSIEFLIRFQHIVLPEQIENKFEEFKVFEFGLTEDSISRELLYQSRFSISAVNCQSIFGVCLKTGNGIDLKSEDIFKSKTSSSFAEGHFVISYRPSRKISKI